MHDLVRRRHPLRAVSAALLVAALVLLALAPPAAGARPSHEGGGPGRSGSAPGRQVPQPPDEPPPADQPPPPDEAEPPADDPAPPADDPAPPVDDPAPPADDPAPPAVDVAPFYAAHSPWNTPLPDDAPIHPDTPTFLTSFATSSTGIVRRLTSDPTQYTYPLYRVDATTPLATITLSGNYSHVHDETRTERQLAPTLQVPIPAHAQPSAGTDASVVIWDPETGDEWGFWEFQPVGDGTFRARNGYRYNTRWNGVPPTSPNRFGSRGAGVPYGAGLVRRDELDAGVIEHALAFAYDFPTAEVVWPATKSDGTGVPGLDVPEGARIRLDPTLTEADLDAWGLSREGRIIARALQRYGMIAIDRAGRPKIMIEDDLTADWRGTVTASTVSAIPWEAFQVVDWRVPQPPVAVLPGDATVVAGSTVQLPGASSYATDGTTLQAYAWSASPTVPLSDATTATPSWDTTGLPGGTRVTFSLQVQDVRGVWSSAPARMTYEIVAAARPTVLEHLAAGGTATDVSTSASWAPRGGDELLTVVALRPARTTVTSVAGNGVTWERVLRRQDEQGELALEVWRATAVAPGSGPVTVRTAAAAWTLNVQHLRLSPSQVVAAVAADTGPIDTRTPHLEVVSRGLGSSVLGVHVGRATPFVPYAGLSTLGQHTVGEGGGLVRVTLLDADERPAGVVGLGGTQSSPLDWVMGGLVLD